MSGRRPSRTTPPRDKSLENTQSRRLVEIGSAWADSNLDLPTGKHPGKFGIAMSLSMASAYNGSLLHQVGGDDRRPARSGQLPIRCPDLVGFLAICAWDPAGVTLRLPPYITSENAEFEDVVETGGSFHFRKVRTATLPQKLRRALPAGRDFVAVKHPVVRDDDGERRADLYSDMATELQIFRHTGLRDHANVADFYGIMYHEDGDGDVVPALVMEFAEYGSVRTYQELGYARSAVDKVHILVDASHGLQALHEAGLVHGDLKTSNLLVCKHPSRKFVVKLTDFGYSFTQDEEFAVGTTEYLGAVEARQRLDPRYVCQLDIYAFGLLTHTVFNNGRHFYETIPEELRPETVDKMKRDGLLAPILQLNLLLGMAAERFPLMLVCKILAYALQPDPSRRFGSIAKISTLLELIESGLAEAARDDTQQLSQGRVRTLQDSFASGMQRHLDKYLASLDRDGITMPLAEQLKSQLLERISIEVSFFMGGQQPANGREMVSYSRSDAQLLMIDSIGLVPEPELAYTKAGNPSGSQVGNQFQFCTNFMIDAEIMGGGFTNLPAPVQTAIVDCLASIARDTAGNANRSLAAQENLAICHAIGYGTEVDLGQAASMLLAAARRGSTKAQRLYADIFQYLPGVTRLGDSEERAWLRAAVAAGDRLALERVKRCFGDEYAGMKKLYQFAVSLGTCPTCASGQSPQGVCERLDWLHWRKPFLRLAVAHELPELVARLLSEDASLLDEPFENGETPLILACRMGSSAMVSLLVDKGAAADKADRSGVTPLHWLVAFEEGEKVGVAEALVRNGADVNALAHVEERRPFDKTVYDRTVFETPTRGTPLHWAVAENDLAGLEVLLDLGADATAKAHGPAFSCLEMACSMTRSAAARRLLEIPAVVDEARGFMPSRNSPELSYNPFFYLTRPRNRWRRLLECGARFEEEAEATMRALVDRGVSPDAVERFRGVTMSGLFSAVYRRCGADMLRVGLGLGFARQMESTFPAAVGTALSHAIAHRDRAAFDLLLEHGADVNVVDARGFNPLHRAAEATDDPYFARRLLDAGASLEPLDPTQVSAFYIAVGCGNFRVADFLFERGADRDRMCLVKPPSPDTSAAAAGAAPPIASPSPPSAPNSNKHRQPTILGEMLLLHTRNSARRAEYLLQLPDRPSPPSSPAGTPVSDGFVAAYPRGWPQSALHRAVSVSTENPDDHEITRVMVGLVLDCYAADGGADVLDSTAGTHHGTALASAAETGNYAVALRLLGEGASASVADEYARTPLDLVLWRHHYPERTPAFAGLSDDEVGDALLVGRVLRFVNRNTADLYELLRNAGARSSVFVPPAWAVEEARVTGKSMAEPRGVDWVLRELREQRENREEEPSRTTEKPLPWWGGLPIRIPERPRQFFEGPGPGPGP